MIAPYLDDAEAALYRGDADDAEDALNNAARALRRAGLPNVSERYRRISRGVAYLAAK